jgi:DNA-binding NarL/FixJ family response regulator
MIFLCLNDQSERREGLKALLRQVNRHATTIDARDWRQAQRVVERTPPDLLLIDWQSQWMKVADLTLFLSKHPTLPAAVLADDARPSAVATFMQAGVLGVVPRDLAPKLIVRAFELVLLGGHYVPARALDLDVSVAPPYCPKRAEHVAGALTRKVHIEDLPPLSPRQHQIMRLVHLGSTNKVIARALGISEGTVKIHLSCVFRALGATNRAAAVAIYNGWQFNGLRALRRDTELAALEVPGADNDAAAEAVVASIAPVQQADMAARWLMAAEPEAAYHAVANRNADRVQTGEDEEDRDEVVRSDEDRDGGGDAGRDEYADADENADETR